LSATSWGLSLERAAQVGNLIAAHALEGAGGQEYTLVKGRFIERLAHAYGEVAAAEVAPHLSA
jgi:adenosine kinase